MAQRRRKPDPKRSRAAKKGWETRRKKQSLIKAIDHDKKLIKVVKTQLKKKKHSVKRPKGKKAPNLRISKRKTVEQLEEMLAKANQEIAWLTRFKTWVSDFDDEYLHKDGSIALYPCKARHWKSANKMRKTMREYYDEGGEIGLKVAINELSGVYDLTTRELYTLWFSP